MADFLLEILSEEIPSSMQLRAARMFSDIMTTKLSEQGLKVSLVRCLVTPRRLVLHLTDFPERQPDRTLERKGPRLGAPARAIEGFARSAGVAVGDLTERTTGKGEFWFASTVTRGRATADVLAATVPEAMAALVWPKSMRWADHDTRWVRPVISILALFDGAVVPFSYGTIESAAMTRGHRFLSPQSFEVTGYADYRQKLNEALVMPDHGERRRFIDDEAQSAAAELGLVADPPPALLDELAGLVEWPVVMAGAFDTAYMNVPEEVLTTEMIHHQRYIPLRERMGALAPRFLFVANIEGRDGGSAIRRGNERVLAARLSDGRHFWEQDLGRTLESRVEDLSSMVFHARLGRVNERARRLEVLARWLASAIPGCDPHHAGRAALLAKADLVSATVGEFPELQGIMGSHLARHDGEPEDVATAIAEHYRPRGPGDDSPTAPVSVAVALAERLDTLVGFFLIGKKPTGSGDPFALRRAAQGLLRLIIDNSIRLELFKALGVARNGYASKKDVSGEVFDFLTDRLKVHLRETGTGHDLIDAVFFARRDDDLVRLLRRVTALGSFLATQAGGDLLEAYRRAANIVRIEEERHGETFDKDVDFTLLAEKEERAIADALAETDACVLDALEGERFECAMEALASLRSSMGAFFDTVTVNADDSALRVNRLNLLGAIRSTMDLVADFSRIEG